jgi:hypothetical protein
MCGAGRERGQASGAGAGAYGERSSWQASLGARGRSRGAWWARPGARGLERGANNAGGHGAGSLSSARWQLEVRDEKWDPGVIGRGK